MSHLFFEFWTTFRSHFSPRWVLICFDWSFNWLKFAFVSLSFPSGARKRFVQQFTVIFESTSSSHETFFWIFCIVGSQYFDVYFVALHWMLWLMGFLWFNLINIIREKLTIIALKSGTTLMIVFVMISFCLQKGFHLRFRGGVHPKGCIHVGLPCKQSLLVFFELLENVLAWTNLYIVSFTVFLRDFTSLKASSKVNPRSFIRKAITKAADRLTPATQWTRTYIHSTIHWLASVYLRWRQQFR